MSTADIPEELQELFKQTLFDQVLHYALFIGAIFQLICIAAIVVIPPKSEEEESSSEGSDQEGTGGTNGKKSQDTAQVIKGSGPGASSQGGGAKSKGGTSKKARKRK